MTIFCPSPSSSAALQWSFLKSLTKSTYSLFLNFFSQGLINMRGHQHIIIIYTMGISWCNITSNLLNFPSWLNQWVEAHLIHHKLESCWLASPSPVSLPWSVPTPSLITVEERQALQVPWIHLTLTMMPPSNRADLAGLLHLSPFHTFVFPALSQ